MLSVKFVYFHFIVFLFPIFVFCGQGFAVASGSTIANLQTGKLENGRYSFNVMGPLLVGDIQNIESPASQKAWSYFSHQLQGIKNLGAEALSTDVWWGAVEKEDGKFIWDYYDKLVTYIENSGLKWVPIMSFHQLGGNVGDEGYIPPPSWIWKKYIGRPGVKNENSLKYKSEQGNYSSEYPSAWATPFVINDYRKFMEEFQNHFAPKASIITEVNISLGPAGEMRYPSYNSHDKGSGYPSRGALQSYSDLAIQSFKDSMKLKYHDIQRLNHSWGFSLKSFDQIYPPDPSLLNSQFFQGEQFSSYGKDFFDWYQSSLLFHGRQVLKVAQSVFNQPQAPFHRIPLGAKIPGVHWRVSIDRLAELAAGLINTHKSEWNSDSYGHGYLETLQMFQSVSKESQDSQVILHFTALEMDNGREGPQVGSEAKSLVFWVGRLAQRLQLIIKGENALAGELSNTRAWYNMKDALQWGGYQGLTILRLDPLLSSSIAREGFQDLVNFNR